jgi:exopolysaccharide biosynthesis polyprenyl glycosylphosphotransferase
MAVLDHREGFGLAPNGGAGGGAGLQQDTLAADHPGIAVVRSEPRWQSRYVRMCVLSDALVAVSSAVVAVEIQSRIDHPIYTWQRIVLVTLAMPVVWLAAVCLNRAYEPRFLGVGSEEFRRVARAGIFLTAAVTFVAYAAQVSRGRHFLLISLPLVTVLTLAERYALRQWLHRRRAAGEFLHRVVVVGHEVPVLEMLRRLGSERYHGLQVVAACLPLPGQRPALMERSVPVVGGFGSVATAVRLTDADTVAVLASEDLGPEQLRRLAWDLEPTGAHLLVAPSLVEVAGPRLSIRPVTGLPLLQVELPQFTGGRRLVKVTFDRTIALALIVLAAPIMLAIAAAVRLTSHGPAFFRQQRIGKDGQVFTMWKFRSMVVDAEQLRERLIAENDTDGLMFKMRTDPRVTRVGAWLRRYSLDELPQLFNVLGGSMSMVGPRPPLPEEVAQYGEDVRRRLLVRPGVTGMWQVSGRADLSWEESVRLDLRYVDNWSLALDLLILWKTTRAVIRGSGAY